MRDWLGRALVKTLYTEPACPWENGYIESFNGKPGDEPLNGEIFFTLAEAGSHRTVAARVQESAAVQLAELQAPCAADGAASRGGLRDGSSAPAGCRSTAPTKIGAGIANRGWSLS